MRKYTKKEDDHATWMLDKHGDMMFRIISASSHIEIIIDELVSFLICPVSDKIADDIIKYLILGQTFGSKIRLLRRLLRDKYKEDYDKYGEDIDSLEKLCDFRNLLAHSVLAFNEREIKKLDDKRLPIYNTLRSRDQAIYISLEDYKIKRDEYDRLIDIFQSIRDYYASSHHGYTVTKK